MSIIKKIITKSNSHQMATKTKQFNLYFFGKVWDLPQMQLVQLVSRSTKRAKRCEVQSTFPFLKTINFTVINVIRYQLKSPKCSYISTYKAFESCHYSMFDCYLVVQDFKNNLINDYCCNLKRNQKSLEMYKYNKV